MDRPDSLNESSITKELFPFRIEALHAATVDELYLKALVKIREALHTEISFLYLLTKNDCFELKHYCSENTKFPLKQVYTKDENWLGQPNTSIRELDAWSTKKMVVQGKHKTMQIMIAPMLTSTRLFGIMGIIDKTDKVKKKVIPFTHEDNEIFLEFARLSAELAVNKKIANKLNFVLETISEVKKKKTKKEIFQFLADKLTRGTSKFSGCIVHLHDQIKDNLYGYVSAGIEFKLEGSSRVIPGQDVIGEVFSDGMTRIVRADAKDFKYPDWAKRNGFISMITVQLKGINEDKFGTLSLFTKYAYQEESNDNLFIHNFFRQVSLVIDSIQVEERMKKLSDLDDIISRIIPMDVEVIPTDVEVEGVLDIFLDGMLKHLNGELGYISLFTKDSERITATRTRDITGQYPDFSLPDTLHMREKSSICWWVIKNRKGYFYPSDEEVDKLFVSYKNIGSYTINSELLAPMIYDNELIGVVLLSSTRHHAFNKEDLSFLEMTAKKVSQVIQSKKFYNSSIALNHKTFEQLDENQICQEVAEITTEILETPLCCVWLIREKDGEEYLSLKGCKGCTIGDMDPAEMKKSDGGLSWTVIEEARERKNENFYSTHNDIDQAESGFRHTSLAGKYGLKSMISAPIIHNQKVLGVINAYTGRKYEFYKTESVLLKNIAIRCADSLSNAYLNARNEELRDKWVATNAIASPGIIAMTFVHDIMHEMQYLKHFIDVLTGYLPKNNDKVRLEAIKSTMGSIAEHSSYISRSVRSLIRMGKRTNVKKTLTPLKPILDEIEHLFKERFKDKNKNIKFSYSIDDDKLSIICFPNEIEQMLVNMMFNSISALDGVTHRKKEIRITITNYFRDSEKYVKIEFYDNGMGINAGISDKIYNFDFSTKGEEGSGFGLSICKRIVVENHQGTINHQSTEGEHTCFFIELPIAH